MALGYLSILLHAHLPFVRHPEHEDFLEEEWLFEAITETYIPLLTRLERLVNEGAEFRLTVSLSPTLTAMLQDDFLQRRYLEHMEKLVQLAHEEVRRTRNEPQFNRLARMYLRIFTDAADRFENRHRRNLVAAFRELQDAGVLEIMTCAATHAFLPLFKSDPVAIRAQVAVGQESHRRAFGRLAHGIWLPECGYYPGLEEILQKEGLRYFVVDSHGIMNANVRPHFGLRAPLACPNGLTAFGRDPESSRQVWSASEGYPGDFDYREFYRDIGFDLDFDIVKPYILDRKTRIFTGVKYFRITGKDDRKEPYDPDAARKKAAVHAEDFLRKRRYQVEHYAAKMDRPPLICCPFDAELFGHWWFEGPQFIEDMLRQTQVTGQDLELITPMDYLDRHPVLQCATPSASSWGWEGYNACWLSDVNDWIYPYLHRAVRRMSELAEMHRQEPPGTLTDRALTQAARSLLIAQASDWTFIMKTGTSVEYAQQRIRDHLARFHYLSTVVTECRVDERKLRALEIMDDIFPFLDFRVFAAHDLPPSHASACP